ncbi:MAG: ROK family transcriptional regulator [Sphaerochaetaceae bacterium]|jgi:predicted NBD/HSP70 family sugar kinase|nr:ROK family transcriptional regulator [Sphaerochaetaceae bacterium]
MHFSQPTAARQINRLRTLNLIAMHEDLSRADVARTLGLNKVSTSEIVDLLLAEGMIMETGTRATAAGRRPVSLELNKDAKMVLVLDIGTRNTSVALINLAGEMLRFERFPTARKPSPEQMAATIILQTQKFLSRMKDPALVSGMAISISGEVEPATGTILRQGDWEWESVPLAFALSKHLKFPLIVENNVKSMILGERWFADINAETTYFYVNWGEHISAAYLAEGKILSHDCQFGHIPVARSGTCRCGAIGCLETLAAGWALVENFPQVTSVKQLCTLAENDSSADSDLLHAAESMGLALVSASAILMPQRIIIGGGIAALPDRYFTALRETFQRAAPPVIRERTTIQRTSLGERAGILGTAAMALDEFVFKRTLLDQLKHQRV